ncbi:MAG: Crp/Fnr family transcriptional regulator [Bacteroidota bacterium]|nr:Crp/Fnr family transcriptional regulator [Bacteroidota bacterium]
MHNNILIEPCNDQCSFCFLNYTDVLSANSLFRGLRKSEIGNIIRDVHHSVKEYRRGELIAFEGDSYVKLILIVKGSVVGEMVDFEGRVLRVEQRKAPETVATVFIFGENNRLPVTITALEETRLLFIPRDDLLQLFTRNRTVLKNFMDIMANRAQFLSMHLKLLGLNSIKGKIAHYLLGQVKEQGKDEIRISHTQTELSEMFGVTRPSVGRELRRMNDDGIISSRGKNIRIIDKSKLSSLLK